MLILDFEYGEAVEIVAPGVRFVVKFDKGHGADRTRAIFQIPQTVQVRRLSTEEAAEQFPTDHAVKRRLARQAERTPPVS